MRSPLNVSVTGELLSLKCLKDSYWIDFELPIFMLQKFISICQVRHKELVFNSNEMHTNQEVLQNVKFSEYLLRICFFSVLSSQASPANISWGECIFWRRVRQEFFWFSLCILSWGVLINVHITGWVPGKSPILGEAMRAPILPFLLVATDFQCVGFCLVWFVVITSQDHLCIRPS